jgi:hypothetical protein
MGAVVLSGQETGSWSHRSVVATRFEQRPAEDLLLDEQPRPQPAVLPPEPSVVVEPLPELDAVVVVVADTQALAELYPDVAEAPWVADVDDMEADQEEEELEAQLAEPGSELGVTYEPLRDPEADADDDADLFASARHGVEVPSGGGGPPGGGGGGGGGDDGGGDDGDDSDDDDHEPAPAVDAEAGAPTVSTREPAPARAPAAPLPVITPGAAAPARPSTARSPRSHDEEDHDDR